MTIKKLEQNEDYLEKEAIPKLKEVVYPILEEGRPNYDLKHTQAVVFWADSILHNYPEAKKNCVLISAYLHDIGYYQEFSNEADTTIEEVRNKKGIHMEKGALMAQNILSEEDFDFLTEEEKSLIIYLVSIHDDKSVIAEIRETCIEAQILFEADTLGALDILKYGDPTFSGNSALNYLRKSIPQRIALFKTPESIQTCETLKKQFASYILMRDRYLLSRQEIKKAIEDFGLTREELLGTQKPLCIFTRGLPGAGKTTTIKLAMQKSDIEFVYLNPDEIDLNGMSKKELYRWMLDEAIRNLLIGKHIIWDQPWTSTQGLDDTLFNLNHFLHIGWHKPTIFEFNVDPEISKTRVKERKNNGGHGPSENTMEKFILTYGDIKDLTEVSSKFKLDTCSATPEMLAEQIKEILSDSLK